MADPIVEAANMIKAPADATQASLDFKAELNKVGAALLHLVDGLITEAETLGAEIAGKAVPVIENALATYVEAQIEKLIAKYLK
jgi:hypothetical protein